MKRFMAILLAGMLSLSAAVPSFGRRCDECRQMGKAFHRICLSAGTSDGGGFAEGKIAHDEKGFLQDGDAFSECNHRKGMESGR